MRNGWTIAGLALLLAVPGALEAADPLPNFVILFTDDMGYGDLGCYGHPTIRTPNLDRMAADGMRFTQFYCAAPVCTPSRAAIMTGRLPIRSGMCRTPQGVLFPFSAGGLPAEELTIAEALKAKDYATACIGKWHLGHLPQYLPTHNGFDYYFGLPYSNDMGARRASKGVPLLRNEEIIEDPADLSTLTPRYTEEAIRFINANREKPFFLYLPYTYPHVPLNASGEFRGRSARGLYGDVVEEVDWSVGRILDTLKSSGLSERTLVIFSSDNGPWLVKKLDGGSAGLLREGKGTTWEGGMRVPGIALWPGRIKPAVTLELASTLDLLPTFLALAGIPVPKDRILDGYDITPVLMGTGPSPRNTMIYYNGAEIFAIRKGRYKMHLATSLYSQRGMERHDPPLLFDLLADPSEQFDVAADHADVIADLRKELDAHKATVKPVPCQLDAQLPSQPAK
jgi:arylsulfatase A-like enzyme